MQAIDNYFNIVGKRLEGQRQLEKQKQLQRRNTVTDEKSDFKTMLRGVDRIYTAFRITTDMQFIMRYSFNLHIRPYTTPYATSVSSKPVSLTTDGNTITPNPHFVKMDLDVQITEHTLDTSQLRISIQGVDITDAIVARYGKFVNGYGYFPSVDNSFDILEILDYLFPWEQSVLLSPGRKEIEISQSPTSLCECEISYYIKHNHVDRGGLD